MFPFLGNKSWFESYWYGERLRPKRRLLAMNLPRVAVCIVLVLVGAFVAGQLRSSVRARSVHTTHTGSMME